MAEEIRRLWIETTYEQGLEVPLPTYPEEYSGKFNVRLPKSLHRSLAAGADRQGVSLNQYVVDVLARGDAQVTVEHRLDALEGRVVEQLAEQVEGLRFPMTQTPFPGDRQAKLTSSKRPARARSYEDVVAR